MELKATSVLAAALSFAAVAQSAPVTYCPSNSDSVCFTIAIPDSTAGQGSGNIYFQISAPTSYQWVSLGTGTSMSGSNMFLMYQDGSGNVTLSPRRGTGRTTPSLDTSSTAAQLQLLEGSGVTSDGKMVANVVCPNCVTWSAGTLSLTSAAGWIGAWKTGSSLATTNTNARISQHDDTVTFEVDSSRASVSSDSNPFVSQATDGGGTDGGGTDGGASGGGASGGGVSGGGGASGDSANGNGGNGVNVVSATTTNRRALAAHGVVMALVFAALYPLGSLLMPLVKKWKVHAGWQAVTFVLMWIGFGTGIRAARDSNLLFNNPHTVLGAIIVCLLGIQPLLGYLHHRYYCQAGGRGLISYVHIWWGRILLAVGVINGGVGLHITSERQPFVIAYSVIAAATFLAWTLVKLATQYKNRNGEGYKEQSSIRGHEMPMRPYQPTRKERNARFQ